MLILFLFIVPALSFYLLSPLNYRGELNISQIGEGVLEYEGGKLVAIIKINVSGYEFTNVFLVSALILNTSYKYISEGQNKIILTSGENTLIIPFNTSTPLNLQANKTYFILITLSQGETFRASAIYI
mgnify:CR=1 FL=1